MNNLIFQTTAFSDPQGAATFAAMKWRIAEVEPDSTVPDPDPGTDTVLIQPQSQWRYFKGTQEPSATYEAWRLLDFNDDPASTSWIEDDAPVGYDPSVTMGSYLDDMRDNYTTIYLRKEFTIDDLQHDRQADPGGVFSTTDSTRGSMGLMSVTIMSAARICRMTQRRPTCPKTISTKPTRPPSRSPICGGVGM